MKKILATTLITSALAAIATANNVTAEISSGDLNLSGDAFANTVRVERTPTAVRVTGQNGTRINGLPSVLLPTGPLVNVTALMDGGNDTVTFIGVGSFGDINIEGGLGNDALFLSQATFTGNVNIKGEEGNDRAFLRSTQTLGDISLDMGPGANTVGASFSSGNNFIVKGGELADRIDLGALTLTGSLDVASDKGADVVNAVQVETALSAEFNLDEGMDRLTATNVITGLDFKVATGAQNDTVILSTVRALFNIGISLDEGNDLLRTSNVSAGSDAIAIGGAGFDTFTNLGFLGTIKTEVIEFE